MPPHEEGTGEQSKQLTSDRRNRKGSGLDSMVLAELKQLAAPWNQGPAMRKSQLIDAIQSAQRGPGAALPWIRSGKTMATAASRTAATAEMSPAHWMSCNERRARPATSARRHRCSSTPYSLSWSLRPAQQSDTRPAARPVETVDDGQVRRRAARQDGSDSQQVADRSSDHQETAMMASGRTRLARIGRTTDGIRGGATKVKVARTSSAATSSATTRSRQGRQPGPRLGRGRRRPPQSRGRSRDRQNRRNRGGGNLERYDEPVISEDDVLVPARGILDVLDNYAFVRTNGYLPGPDDAYVSFDGQEARLA